MAQTVSRSVPSTFQAHPMTFDDAGTFMPPLDPDWQPDYEPDEMGNARRAIGQALIRAYAVTCGSHRPSPAMLAYFRDVIHEEDRLHEETIARLDRLMAKQPPPITYPRVIRVGGLPNPMPIRDRKLGTGWGEEEPSADQ